MLKKFLMKLGTTMLIGGLFSTFITPYNFIWAILGGSLCIIARSISN